MQLPKLDAGYEYVYDTPKTRGLRLSEVPVGSYYYYTAPELLTGNDIRRVIRTGIALSHEDNKGIITRDGDYRHTGSYKWEDVEVVLVDGWDSPRPERPAPEPVEVDYEDLEPGELFTLASTRNNYVYMKVADSERLIIMGRHGWPRVSEMPAEYARSVYRVRRVS